jgi:hypothetical protein
MSIGPISSSFTSKFPYVPKESTWTWYDTICQNPKEWSNMPTKHCFQIGSPFQHAPNGIQLTKTWVPTQSIHILIDCPNLGSYSIHPHPYWLSQLGFDIKIIFLKNENTSCQLPNWLIKLVTQKVSHLNVYSPNYETLAKRF